jgi:hypothetical protein
MDIFCRFEKPLWSAVTDGIELDPEAIFNDFRRPFYYRIMGRLPRPNATIFNEMRQFATDCESGKMR